MTDERLANLRNCERLLGYRFNNIDLLDNALIHSSFVNENPALSCKDNERLEFLGDSVIGLCLSDLLTRRFPDYAEGQLSKLRAYLINEQSLAGLARRLSIGDFLLLGKGEEASAGRTKASILSNAFEAVAAAVYLDSGFEKTYGLLGKIFEPVIEEGTKGIIYKDYKTALQEICQNRFKETPRYVVTHETGPDHDRIFEVCLSVAGVMTAAGTGKSKKEAEQRAARRALEGFAKPEDTPPPLSDDETQHQ